MPLRSGKPRGCRRNRFLCRDGDEARRVLHLGIDQGDGVLVKQTDVPRVEIRLQLSKVVLLAAMGPRLTTGWQDIRVIASAGNLR